MSEPIGAVHAASLDDPALEALETSSPAARQASGGMFDLGQESIEPPVSTDGS
jgi:hypothetical protein